MHELAITQDAVDAVTGRTGRVPGAAVRLRVRDSPGERP
jgi:hypothetical protein